jgi:hypothetical protein
VQGRAAEMTGPLLHLALLRHAQPQASWPLTVTNRTPSRSQRTDARFDYTTYSNRQSFNATLSFLPSWLSRSPGSAV